MELSEKKAINAKEIKVTFNKKVDEDFLGSYTLSDGKTVTDAELQEDGRTVILTLSAAFDNTTEHSVGITVKNAKLAGTEDTYFALYTQVVKVKDTTNADVDSIKAVTNGTSVTTFTVNLTEAVQSGFSVKVNGAAASSAVLSADGKTITVTVSTALKVGETQKLTLVNLTDAAGNVNSLVNKDFSVTQDTVAPTITSVEPYGDNQVLVTFGKKMKASTVVKANIAVKNDQLNAADSATEVSALPGDTTGTKFLLNVDPTGLYTTAKPSHTFTLLFKANALEDSLGNKLETATRTVTLTKDSVAPEVTGTKIVKNSAGEVTAIELTFSEGLAAKASNAIAFPTTVVNSNGVIKNTSDIFGTVTSAAVAKGSKTVRFNLATPAVVSGEYSIDFAKNLVTDNAFGTPNQSKAYSTVLNFGKETAATNYTIPQGNVINVGGSNNKFQVTFPDSVKGGKVAGSATDLSNYTLNGSALPEGTTITLNSAQTIATITLPTTQSVAKNDNEAIFTINNVQTLSGVSNKAFTKTLVIKDNTAPKLTSARVLSDKSVELTYDEAVAFISGANVGTEFSVSTGSTTTTFAANEVTVTPVSGYANKAVLTFDKTLTAATNAVSATAPITGTNAGKVIAGALTNATTTAAKTYTVNAAGTKVLDGATEVADITAGAATINQGGVAFSATGLVTGDSFTLATTAAVPGTSAVKFAFDSAKDYSITTLANVTNLITDASGQANEQAEGLTVSISK